MTDAEAALLATTRKQGNHLMASQKKIKYVSKVYNLFDLRNEYNFGSSNEKVPTIFLVGFDALLLLTEFQMEPLVTRCMALDQTRTSQLSSSGSEVV